MRRIDAFAHDLAASHAPFRLARLPDRKQVRLRPVVVAWLDTALFGAPHAVRCVVDFFGPEHVLFGTDMPLGPPNAIEATIARPGCGRAHGGGPVRDLFGERVEAARSQLKVARLYIYVTQGIEIGVDGIPRCWWGAGDPLYRRYHDTEWGRPVSDDRRLFEKLSLEGFMSGLSWLTILRKRESFRAAFANFVPEKVATFRAADQRRLMADAGIVRNSAKIAATINNARSYRDLKAEFGSLAAYVWSFEPPARTRLLDHAALMQIKFSPEAAAMSKDLRKRGWAFVGPTTVHSFMQAMGLVNDHLQGCQVGEEVEQLRRAFKRPG